MHYSSAVLFTATLSTPVHSLPPPLHTGTRISVLPATLRVQLLQQKRRENEKVAAQP